MMLPDMLPATYVQMLDALSAWLTKAEAQRLAVTGTSCSQRGSRPTCSAFNAGSFRMPAGARGRFPVAGSRVLAALQSLLDEGRDGGEAPRTMAAAQGRIAETLAEAAEAEGIAIDPASSIAHAFPIGMVLDVTAERYARD